ncbi:MAG: energy-dependent translational throttle protein EttA [Actinobacteria bacterium]|nr:energy-dependent translational throttle protein EttA [Actinomycetota bacterium]MBM3697197.1 energy-dependent translational throttle protein EttA [Actinomycetota bacterium]
MSTNEFIYQMHKVRMSYPPDKVVLDDITLAFLPGAKIGVLGLNGAGKSTLLKIMAGEVTPSNGDAMPGKGVKVGYLPQEPRLDETKDVRANVEEGVAERRDLLNRFNEMSAKLGEPMEPDEMQALLEDYQKVQDAIERTNSWDLDRQVEVAMDALRVPPGDADLTTLSGGEKRRVALCRLLLSAPDMLLLDEPTNHLDAESVGWLERFLDEYPGTVVAVTHDRYFLDNVAGWILELDNGRGIPWQGNYSSWLDQKEKRLAQEEKQASKRQKAIARELEWVRTNPKGRQAKSKARVANYEQLVAEEADVQKRGGAADIRIPLAPRLGDKVVEATGLSKAFGDKLLFDDLSFSLPPGGIVGIIGPNGAGKTTLFRMITGQEQPDGGSLDIGETVRMAYVDQSRDELDPKKTVYDEIAGGRDVIDLGGGNEVQARAYTAAFNFRGSDQQKPVGQLSGGERNRVHMAKMLSGGGNLLLLDEPTNDLDVDTLRALETALETFSGCAVIITHDRWFLDREATHILAFEGDSNVVWFEGSYSEYEENRRTRMGVDADTPHRIRYRRLTTPA